MYNSNRTRNPYSKQIIANTIYVVIAILIVICGVYALIVGEAGRIFYPIVFLLAAVLNFTDGIPRLFGDVRTRQRKITGVILCIIGLVLIAVAAVIARVVWW